MARGRFTTKKEFALTEEEQQRVTEIANEVKALKADKKGKGKGAKKTQGDTGFTEQFSGPLGSGNGYRLNVKNIGETMTNEQLKALFEPFGTVVASNVKTYNDGTGCGFGYVILPGEEDAKAAIAAMNGKEVGGKALYVAPAERRAAPAEGKGGKAALDGGKGKGKGGKSKGKGYDPYQQAAAASQMALYQQQLAYAQAQQYFLSLQLAAAYNYQQQQQLQAGRAMGGQQGFPQMPQGLMAPSQEYEGSIKSLYHNRHGFIVCAETFQKYGRDVYFDKNTLPAGAKIADRLKFTLELNEKGHPRVKEATMASMK